MVDLPAPVDLAAPFLVELRLRSGKVQYVRVPAQESPCPYAVRSTLLDLLPYASGSEGSLVELHRALVRTLERCARERRVVADWWIGEAPASPEVSVIVPLFGELDLLESQLTEFAKDAEWRARAELIYVLDEPDRTQHLERLSRELHAIYGVPARFIALAENGGFGAATNEGARHARGELLVLLNSDVVPDEPGWIGASVDAFRAQPGIGVLGPKLLYEDGSLQHAGIFFAPNRVRIHDGSGRPVDIDIWKNHQFYKGYPGTLPEANIARDVPAVSAACMMTPRALFHELGGLDESYVLGDCEDSDYCLRVAERGLRVRYEPRFALYHLEGQSYPDRSRRLVSVFNNWQQDRRWRAAMTARMTAFERATAGTGGPP
jgi:GT2 family glycosyltransferase